MVLATVNHIFVVVPVALPAVVVAEDCHCSPSRPGGWDAVVCYLFSGHEGPATSKLCKL